MTNAIVLSPWDLVHSGPPLRGLSPILRREHQPIDHPEPQSVVAQQGPSASMFWCLALLNEIGLKPAKLLVGEDER
jgi:hypothetical protein